MKDQHFLIIRSEDGTTGKTVSFNGESFVLERLEWKGWAMERRWCLEGYLIASSASSWDVAYVDESVGFSGTKDSRCLLP